MNTVPFGLYLLPLTKEKLKVDIVWWMEPTDLHADIKLHWAVTETSSALAGTNGTAQAGG